MFCSGALASSITARQFLSSITISFVLLILILRLVQKGRLDIAYCWLWLGIGVVTVLIVTRYEWLLSLSEFIGAKTPTTTLFLLGFLVVLLMCLQFSLVISSHRRHIKRLNQQLAILGQGGQNNGSPASEVSQNVES
jgi:hypothetical protein